jgi:hypothetical protein
MTKYLAIAFLITGVVIFLSSCSKPDNYDDCILEHIKANQTKDAVWAIEEACQNKFPPKP